MAIAFHLGMVVVTGGLWLIVLIVIACVKIIASTA